MYISNWTVRLAPGTAAEVIEVSEAAAKLWEKHGANECHLLDLQGSDVGCMSFIAQFDSAEAYGKSADSIEADPDFQAVMGKANAIEGDWVRHNLARRIF